ncbi:uncharacterized protein LOC135165868 [Diachasmimorpha longicaudata]|uniref:uncharacterized protein LOC135165868 n=1 Tax=Diachasmimorpha longicaudata TaxID=58733 RepID=UPI0030B8FC49
MKGLLNLIAFFVVLWAAKCQAELILHCPEVEIRPPHMTDGERCRRACTRYFPDSRHISVIFPAGPDSYQYRCELENMENKPRPTEEVIGDIVEASEEDEDPSVSISETLTVQGRRPNADAMIRKIIQQSQTIIRAPPRMGLN